MQPDGQPRGAHEVRLDAGHDLKGDHLVPPVVVGDRVRGIAVDGDGQRVLTHADIQVEVELDDQLVVRPVYPLDGRHVERVSSEDVVAESIANQDPGRGGGDDRAELD